jgi:Rieske Fe-S protein
MGCQLDFAPNEQAFICPCHGAEFSLSGKLTYGPGGYGYTVALPPLPQIKVRQRHGAIEVWSV